MTHEKKIRGLVCAVLGNPECMTVGIDSDLQFLGMDSLNCVRLIIAIEEEFVIEISEDKIGVRYINTIERIQELIKEAAAK